MTQPTSEAEVRNLLERRLGHAARDDIWGDLVRREWVDGVLSDRGLVGELLEEYRAVERQFPAGRRTTPSEPTKREIGPDTRLKALARKLAQQAAEEPAVVVFRAEVLGGQLLAPEDVEAWVNRQGKAEGDSTLYLGDVAVPLGHTVEHDREGIWATPPLTLSRETPARRAAPRFLAYAIPDQQAVSRVPVAQGGTLDRLRRLSESLASSYGWRSAAGEAQAALFVLTGQPPVIPRATITWHIDAGSAVEGRITLDLDPTLGPAAVARLYREARAQFPLRRRSRRYRPMTEKHARLAEWADREGSWRNRMEQWNEGHADPKDRYADPRNFARDVMHAARRLYGETEE